MKIEIEDFVHKDTVSNILLCSKDSEMHPCLAMEIYAKLQ